VLHTGIHAVASGAKMTNGEVCAKGNDKLEYFAYAAPAIYSSRSNLQDTNRLSMDFDRR
jgi:hypothetical protein